MVSLLHKVFCRFWSLVAMADYLVAELLGFMDLQGAIGLCWILMGVFRVDVLKTWMGHGFFV